MHINRRKLLQLGGGFACALTMPGFLRAQERYINSLGDWRKFDVATHLSFPKPDRPAQAWIPAPSVNHDDWSKALGSDWTTNAQTARLVETDDGVNLIYLEWDESEAEGSVQISSHAETRSRFVDFTRPRQPGPLSDEARVLYTAPASVMPHGEILRNMAAAAIGNAETDLGKAKAIYEWIAREQSCSTADLKTLLGGVVTSGAIAQDCDYLNRLFVGMARVSGLPAREIQGIRVAPSEFGFESLGAVPEDVTSRVHNRAEVWLEDYGWVPVDPADLHRFMRYEPPGNLEFSDPKVVTVRGTLFGAWEGNWVPFNMAQDLELPLSDGVVAPVLIRPLVRIGNSAPSEALPPDSSYRIVTSELPAGP